MIRPVLRWVGGKRRLLGRLIPRLPDGFRIYHEPFFGGGALFFATCPDFAVVADANRDLVDLYKVIKREPQALIAEVARIPVSEQEFDRQKNLDRLPGHGAAADLVRAARFYYLNRTCFNGLHRVNRHGQFNSGYGHPVARQIVDAEAIMAIHHALRTTRIAHAPFDAVLDTVRRGDFVYLDPPYDCEGNGFNAYTPERFSRADQHRLWQVCVKLHRLGVKWMLSNGDTAFIRTLFRAFRVEAVEAVRTIAASGGARRPAREVIVRNY